MTGSHLCPGSEKLRQFAVGQLAGPEMDTLARHLERCSLCEQRLQANNFRDVILTICQEEGEAEPPPLPLPLVSLMQRLKTLGGP
jgi:hypothetical protein